MKRAPIFAVALTAVLVILTACAAQAPPEKTKRRQRLRGSPLTFTAGGALWVVGADGSGLRRITDGSEPAEQPVWSPDKKSIAFKEGLNRALTIYNLQTRKKLRVKTNNGKDVRLDEEGGLSWNPDRKTLALNIYQGYKAGTIFYYRLVGGFYFRFWRQDPDETVETDPSFSPDGRQLVFSWNEAGKAGEKENVDLWRINTDGSDLVKLFIAGSDRYTGSADWSEPGDLIAFEVRRKNGIDSTNSEYSEIFAIRPDGQGYRLLADNGRSPAFSPDGRRIAFIRDHRLWVMDADSSWQRQVPGIIYAENPDW